jgi:TonB family protein
MNRVWFHIVLCGLLFDSLARAQRPDGTSSTPEPEHGIIVSNTYANEFLGFWFPIPDGWQVNRESAGAGREGEAKRITGGGLELLVIDRGDRKHGGSRIVISAMDATGYSAGTPAFASSFVRGPIGATGGEVLREALPVDFAGQHFFRGDYRQDFKGGSQWGAFVCTKFNGYFIGWTFVTYSAEELESLVDSLHGLSFRDQSVPIVGGIVVSHLPAGVARPQRIRVSTRVSENLLIKRIEPDYPENARQKHVEGSVTLIGLIDKNGNVAELSVVGGPNLLVPAALEAVRKWKYKPYLLQGEPLAMQTLIVVPFLLLPQ